MPCKNKVLPDNFIPDNTLSDRIMADVPDNTLTCVQAFRLSAELGIPENELGYYLDYLKISLNKCQIGLFGHAPAKKLIEKKDRLDGRLESVVRENAPDNVITCYAVFSIAESLGISKVDVGSACETLGIKIRQCRFGAF